MWTCAACPAGVPDEVTETWGSRLWDQGKACRHAFSQPGKAEKLPVCLRFTLPRQRCGLNV